MSKMIGGLVGWRWERVGRARSVLRRSPTETSAMRPASNSWPVTRFRTKRCGITLGNRTAPAAASLLLGAAGSRRSTNTCARVSGSSSWLSRQPVRTSTHRHGSCVPTHSYVSEYGSGSEHSGFRRMSLLWYGTLSGSGT